MLIQNRTVLATWWLNIKEKNTAGWNREQTNTKWPSRTTCVCILPDSFTQAAIRLIIRNILLLPKLAIQSFAIKTKILYYNTRVVSIYHVFRAEKGLRFIFACTCAYNCYRNCIDIVKCALFCIYMMEKMPPKNLQIL